VLYSTAAAEAAALAEALIGAGIIEAAVGALARPGTQTQPDAYRVVGFVAGSDKSASCARAREAGAVAAVLAAIRIGFAGRNADGDALMTEALSALNALLVYDLDCRREANAAPGTAALVLGILRAHATDAIVQMVGCSILNSLGLTDMSARLRLGAAGAIEAVVSALKAHPANAVMQWTACRSLYNLMLDTPDHQRKAVALGVVDAVRAAGAAFPDDGRVQREAAGALRLLMAQDGAAPLTGRPAIAGPSTALSDRETEKS
jgi:hypothetical protein